MFFNFGGNRIAHGLGCRTGPYAILEEISHIEANFLEMPAGQFEVLFGLPRKADNDIS